MNNKDSMEPFILYEEQIQQILCELKEREREVIIFRFGLRDGHPHTLEEVGKEFNITRERVRQIEVKALRKSGYGCYRRRDRLKEFLET
ncbi:RNA polymerase sigma factor RpoD [Lachnospiraceae bacterium TWA4]|nr:RNA polymerase sigma factor RpoD [Lachnospiraceae bacterium TWA4]